MGIRILEAAGTEAGDRHEGALPERFLDAVDVAVFAKAEHAAAAQEAGAETVGDDDLIAKIDEGWSDFDVLVAHVDMMRAVGRLGPLVADRLLRGLTDAAIAVSHSTRDFLVNERRVPAERVRVIWNGAPLEEFAPVPRERALAVRRGLWATPTKASFSLGTG